MNKNTNKKIRSKKIPILNVPEERDLDESTKNSLSSDEIVPHYTLHLHAPAEKTEIALEKEVNQSPSPKIKIPSTRIDTAPKPFAEPLDFSSSSSDLLPIEKPEPAPRYSFSSNVQPAKILPTTTIKKSSAKSTKKKNSPKEIKQIPPPIAENEAPKETFSMSEKADAEKKVALNSEKPTYNPIGEHGSRFTETMKSLRQPISKREKHILARKTWNFLEWISVSALIFAVLFFALNFSSYSELLKLKLDQWRGEYSISPYIESMTKPISGTTDVTQELLPQAQDFNQAKKQIPDLSLEVAPPDTRIIIPRINKNVPVVSVKAENLLKRDWSALEKDMQEALRFGVVHYPGTSVPGQHGNVVITGHSSYFAWDPGRFKDVFALLHEVNVGDTVVVYDNQIKYTYKVDEKKVILPTQVDVLTEQGDDRLTLITCTPVGTNYKRLVLIAHPIK